MILDTIADVPMKPYSGADRCMEPAFPFSSPVDFAVHFGEKFVRLTGARKVDSVTAVCAEKLIFRGKGMNHPCSYGFFTKMRDAPGFSSHLHHSADRSPLLLFRMRYIFTVQLTIQFIHAIISFH